MILIGGAGVVPGAIVGGLILGILESFGYGLIAGSMTYLVIFVGVILLLIFTVHYFFIFFENIMTPAIKIRNNNFNFVLGNLIHSP